MAQYMNETYGRTSSGIASGANGARRASQGSRHVSGPRRILTWLNNALDRVLQWQERANERRALRNLSDQMLKDIGISRVDAFHEANKPFWRR